MKKILIAFVLPLFLVLLGGCSKDFLTDENQTRLTNAKFEELKQTPSVAADLLENKLNGVYNLMYQETGVSNRDDVGAGIRFTGYTLDLLCNEIVLPGRCWGLWDYARDFYDSKFYRVRGIWNKFYNMIGLINSIINNDLPQNEEEVLDILKPMYGQVHILRAICYYYLVNIFQLPYTSPGGKDRPGVPLVLKGEEQEIEVRASVEEIYAQIIKDLEVGVKYAGDNEADKSRASADVALTFLTRVYLEMGDYAKAVESAKAVFGGQPFVLPLPNAVQMGFASLDQPEHMWGYYVTSETTIFYGSFASIVDNAGNGYPEIGCPVLGFNQLVDPLGPNDKRRDWFGPGFADQSSPEFIAYCKKWGGFFGNAQLAYVAMKYFSAKDFTADIIYTRYSDVYLMLLEAMYENGDSEDEIRQLLSDFVAERDPDYDASSLSGDALRDAIRYQRRVDLWAEGVAWFDYRRWRIDIDRGTAKNSNHTKILRVVKPDEPFYAFPLPQSEVDQNPKLLPQNPVYEP